MRMDAILFVGHGSRDPEGNRELLGFTERVARHLAEPVIETCFLELALPDIQDGIEACVRQGATRITVVPLMLFPAGHFKTHIPHELLHARERHPHVTFAYTQALGVNPHTLSILVERLFQAGFSHEGPGRSEAAVLVVGRGSSDADANSELYKMSRLLYEHTPVSMVETAFMGVTDPLFAEGIERCVRLGAREIYVLPYFLFTGILIKRMESMIQSLEDRFGIRIVLAQYFGYHTNLIDLVLERIQEARRGLGAPLDELLSSVHEHGHHHGHHHGHVHAREGEST
jgi:sirohydrochlorin cobaltochelatase